MPFLICRPNKEIAMTLEDLIKRIAVQTKRPEDARSSEDLYTSLRARIDSSFNSSVVIRFNKIYKRVAIAATILLLISVGTLVGVLLTPSNNEYMVESNFSNKVKKVMLSDGSNVTLNVGSKLFYPKVFNSSKREVFLVGEAYFDVAKDARKKFIVHAGDLSIAVLGTKFNVKAYANDVDVFTTLFEGSIKLNIANSTFEQILKPNQSFYLNQVSKTAKIENVQNANDDLAWTNEKIVMDNMRIEDVCKELERVYSKHFVILDKEIANKKITGEYSYQEPVDEFLNLLKITAGVDYSITNETIVIKKK